MPEECAASGSPGAARPSRSAAESYAPEARSRHETARFGARAAHVELHFGGFARRGCGLRAAVAGGYLEHARDRYLDADGDAEMT